MEEGSVQDFVMYFEEDFEIELLEGKVTVETVDVPYYAYGPDAPPEIVRQRRFTLAPTERGTALVVERKGDTDEGWERASYAIEQKDDLWHVDVLHDGVDCDGRLSHQAEFISFGGPGQKNNEWFPTMGDASELIADKTEVYDWPAREAGY